MIETFIHAAYVAFVFAVVYIGALAFRQVVDDMEVKALKMGEDRDSFVDAAGAIALLAMWAAILIMVIVI